MKFKSTHRILRAFLARILCLLHMSLSIYVLYSSKKDLIFLLPTIGLILLLVEATVIIVVFKGKEPTRWISTLFLIYVPTIVGCYWFLELENVKKMLKGLLIRNYKFNAQDFDDLTKSVKVIWSQIELQLFFALIIIVRWIIPKSTLTPHGLSELLFKYFAISCDMLDFLTITQDTTLSQNSQLVYWTLSAWSWSTIQFFILVPKPDEKINEFHSYITNSLLSVLFLDLPYFGIRMAAIFAFGSHSYNSYFFAAKNFVLIVLQFYSLFICPSKRIKAIFLERDLKENSECSQLKNRIGFDKEPSKLFDPNEIAKRNFFAQRLKAQEYIEFSVQNSLEGLAEDNYESRTPVNVEQPNNPKRVPRTIETVKNSNRILLKGETQKSHSTHSIDDNMRFGDHNKVSNNFNETRNINLYRDYWLFNMPATTKNASSQHHLSNKFTEV